MLLLLLLLRLSFVPLQHVQQVLHGQTLAESDAAAAGHELDTAAAAAAAAA